MLDLQNKSMKELREIAAKIGLPGVKAESMQSLKARIVITMEPGVIDALTVPELGEPQLKRKEKTPDPVLTPEQVMKELEPLKGRIKLAFYDDAGNMTIEAATTWHVKNGPAEDTGSLSVPINILARKARHIAEARFPAVIKGEFDDVRKIPVLA